MLPVLMHQLTKLHGIACFQRFFATIANFFDEMKILDHFVVAVLRAIFLILENTAGVTRIARKKQQDVVLKIKKCVHGYLERHGSYTVIFMESKAGQAAIRSDVLILFTDRLAQAVNFNMASQFS